MTSGIYHALLYIAPPLGMDVKKDYNISFWMKASRGGVKPSLARCVRTQQSIRVQIGKPGRNGWVFVVGHAKASGDPAQAHRIEFASDRPDPFTVWIDDVRWTQGSSDDSPRSGPVEIVLQPEPRNGMRFAGRPVQLHWVADADTVRQVELELHLRDLTRGGTHSVPWQGNAALGRKPSSGTIELAPLKRGHYMALIAVRDGNTGELLAVGRERFAVMSDLRELPPPVNFVAGTHFGLRAFSWRNFEYNWRGFWTTDEYFRLNYQTGFRIQRVFVNWADLEPRRGEYTWYIDADLRAATRNGCTTMLVFPQWPRAFKPDEYRAIMEGHDNSQGKWLVRQGVDISKYRGGRHAWPANRHLKIIAPPPDAITITCARVAARYRRDLAVIEFMNECNGIVTPEGMLKHIASKAYPMFKSTAPEVPVVLSVTSDKRSPSYAERFFSIGGVEYSDGYTFHPYGWDVISNGGLHAVKLYKARAERASTRQKKLLVGMSECLHIRDGRIFQGWEIVQRTLLDWSSGFRWSCGVPVDRAFAVEAGPRNPWRWRGPFAPGFGAVALNGLYTVLAGAKSLGRVDIDDYVLIALFETRPTPKAYTVALAATDAQSKLAQLVVDLRGVS